MNICFDGSFPETARTFTLLARTWSCCRPTGPPMPARWRNSFPPARSWENHIYYLAVNRVGDEAGFHYIGMSSAADYLGNVLHFAAPDVAETFTFEVNPAAAAQKRVVHCHGVYEIDRVNWRRPDLYGPLGRGGAVSGPWEPVVMR